MDQRIEPKRLEACVRITDGVAVKLDFGWNVYLDLLQPEVRQAMASKLLAVLGLVSPLTIHVSESTGEELRRKLLELYVQHGARNAWWYDPLPGFWKDLMAPYGSIQVESLAGRLDYRHLDSRWMYRFTLPEGFCFPGFQQGGPPFPKLDRFSIERAECFCAMVKHAA